MYTCAQYCTKTCNAGEQGGDPGGRFGEHIGIAYEKEDKKETNHGYAEAGVFYVGQCFSHGSNPRYAMLKTIKHQDD